MEAPTDIVRPGAEETARFVEEYEQFEKSPEGRSPRWLAALRDGGIAHFSESGFPTTRDEEWRVTSVAALAKLPFRAFAPRQTSNVRHDQIGHHALPDTYEMVFVDGFFSPRLSRLGQLPAGFEVLSVAQALEAGHPLLEKHLGRSVSASDGSFAALNTAFFQDGALIAASKDVVVDRPVHLIFIGTGETQAAVQPRNLFVAAPGSRFSVIETHLGLEGALPPVKNTVTEVFVGENAHVEHVKVQDERPDSFHIARIQAELSRDARFRNHSVALGAALSRHDINVHLNDTGIDAVLCGVYLANGSRLCDHHTLMDHRKPHCESHEYYHGILAGQSRGVFNGKIFVRPQAQKTDAKQTNRAILLGRDARVDTKPQLEIFADDVKCTHGATVGELSEEAIHYLRCRGIGLTGAKRMLTHAFALEIVERIETPALREHVDRLVGARLETLV